ncbi:MAG: substrate-binding domain-containing protein [Proteobacteria bacterium]|nr:substrate-binding domain-containing protein [Pseudomonadota bacterium]
MNERQKRASTKDVAKLAGVSLGSVSRVINKFDNVTPEVREKVERAMAALDYRLNHAAKTLRSRSSRTVGCMLTDITNPLYANLFRVFEDKFREAGYLVLLANSMNKGAWEIEILEMFRSRGMDGVLLAPSNERNPQVIAAVNQLDIPAVIVDRDISVQQDQVRFDHVRGIREAASALIAQGHRRIAIILSGVESRPMRRRLEGFRAAFAAHGILPVEELVVRLPSSTENAFARVDALLRSDQPPTAIFSLGTNVLGDVLSAIAARGLRVPQDVSVVSMGDPEFARSHVPAIATVSIDIDFAASESARLLLERMEGRVQGKPRRVLIATQFVPRDSCAEVPPSKTRKVSKTR